MSHHNLKTVQPWFDAIWEGKKTFEVRLNDRFFIVGDTCELMEYCESPKMKFGRAIFVKITYVLNHSTYVRPGYCIFSFEILSKV